MRGFAGGIFMPGKGAIFAILTKQKLNTWNSIEAKLVGVNDMIPQVLWVHYFLEVQRYTVKVQCVIPIPSMCNEVREEWQGIKQQENKAYQHAIFLHH
eukprot:13344379-Ditylum_brightwellii.AAC.1